MAAKSHKNGHNIEYKNDKWVHSDTDEPITMADIPCHECGEKPAIMEILGRPRDIDYCIAPFVKILNGSGKTTVACCCGHGRRPGNIVLDDGREIIIAANFDDARKIDSLFPPIHDDFRRWDKYHQRNKYSECQLITALNAKYYLMDDYISQDSKEYEELVDLCGTRHGSAVHIEKVWDVLDIEIKETYLNSLDWEEKGIENPPLPLEIMVWHKAYGFHSVLAVDYEPKTDALRIANFRHVTSLDGWIFYEDLFHYITENPDKTEPRYSYRQFGLKLDRQKDNK